MNLTRHVYPSPYNPQVLFVSVANQPDFPATGALGLIKSVNGGATWQIVSDLDGISVNDVAFHPSDPAQMVLGTQDGNVYRSSDGGDTWSVVAKPPVSSIGSITYNPYRPAKCGSQSMPLLTIVLPGYIKARMRLSQAGRLCQPRSGQDLLNFQARTRSTSSVTIPPMAA